MARRRIRWKRLILLGGAGSVLLVLALVGIGYAVTDVPKPNDSATATATRILYADRSEMTRVGAENRLPVRIDRVPVPVRDAVLAAEDRGFYTEPGISPKGIARALLTNVRGGGAVSQGGSTITQQYAKNAFLSSERTYTRKVKEVFIALKMTRELSKDQILEDYLNTIYFGRQASGIEVASQKYFGRPVQDLSVAQGAVLAATIRSPANLDPTRHPEAAKERWSYVLDGMVEQGWITPAQRSAQVYPEVLPPGSGPRNNDLSGPKGHVVAQVLDELAARGISEDRLASGGLVVQTTIRRDAQEAATRAVQQRTGTEPGKEGLQGALVSIKPSTGEVWAYYGGATGTGFDYADNSGVGRQPGSSFKPYVLATALSQGLSLRTRLDGNSPASFEGVRKPIVNFGGADYGRVDLLTATRNSVNTAYFELGQKVGPDKVAALAHAAGIPDSTTLESSGGDTAGSIALGSYDVQVMDQASGYATFANRGVPVRPFFVRYVADSAGTEVYNAQVRRGPAAYSPEVAADATYAMEQVVDRGTGRAAQLAGGREAAGKTGTTSENYDVWFCGFTPQLSTAVWFGYGQKRTVRVDGAQGTGGGVAAPVWKSYMDAASDGMEKVDFPKPAFVGGRGGFTSNTPAPRSTRTSAPRRTRAPRSSASPAPDATRVPSAVPSPARTTAPAASTKAPSTKAPSIKAPASPPATKRTSARPAPASQPAVPPPPR